MGARWAPLWWQCGRPATVEWPPVGLQRRRTIRQMGVPFDGVFTLGISSGVFPLPHSTRTAVFLPRRRYHHSSAERSPRMSLSPARHLFILPSASNSECCSNRLGSWQKYVIAGERPLPTLFLAKRGERKSNITGTESRVAYATGKLAMACTSISRVFPLLRWPRKIVIAHPARPRSTSWPC